MYRLKKILIVDDEETNRILLSEILETLGYSSISVGDGYAALEILDSTFDLVLLDVMLGSMNGYEVAQRIRNSTGISDLPIIMVTALSDKKDRLRAVEVGANDFITKPIDIIELRLRAESLLKMKDAQDEIKRHRSELEQTVRERTQTLRQTLREVTEARQKTYEAQLETINRLALAAELKDRDTSLHIKRMSKICGILARGMGLSENDVELVERASPMHDVGKIGIPDSILLKPGKLNKNEREQMNKHSVIGARILGGSSSDLLQAGEVFALTHHERWDGAGYPYGLAREKIPIWGRITAVADVFDALTNVRPYKKAHSNESALSRLKEDSGTHFDPDVIDVFFLNLMEILNVQNKYNDTTVIDTPEKRFHPDVY
ncbi:MAG: response regulator [Calditrichaeota bacterium]|nr:response regulator [Calditrichota bacterium]MBT7616159.1 response regulator [Calditrichota bacterium]MBT7790192.1 response regulator [Calditrichota bacterium]